MIDITLLENAFGDKLGKQFFAFYLSKYPCIGQTLINYYENQNHEELFQLAQTLSADLTNLCEMHLISQLKYIEHISKNGVMPTFTEISNVAQELDDITDQMKNYITLFQATHIQ